MDLALRKRQFVFPRTRLSAHVRALKLTEIDWDCIEDEKLQACYEYRMLPPIGLVYYYLQQEDYNAAVETFKSNQLTDAHCFHSLSDNCQSFVKLSKDLGEEVVQKTLLNDASWFYYKMIDKNVYEDLTPIKHLLPNEVVKQVYERNINDGRTQQGGPLLQYLVQLDSWLHPSSSRRVPGQENNDIQYLSDETQAKYFALLLERSSNEQVIEDSKKASKPLNQMFYNGETLLAHVKDNLSDMVKQFNFDVNVIDMNGMTPLIYAVKNGKLLQLQELLQLGADPCFAGNTLLPLHYSISMEQHNLQTISALLLHGADINEKDYNSHGQTVWPISLALPHGEKLVKFLLRNGADPTVIDEAGNTLLHMLLKNSFIEDTDTLIGLMKLLLPYIDINKKNNLGDSILHCAITQDFNKIILETIIKCGADVNLPDAHGRTPIMLACSRGFVVAVNVLLATNQVDFKARTKEGQSIVQWGLDRIYNLRILADLLKGEEFMRLCQPHLTEDNIQFMKEECKKVLNHSQLPGLVANNFPIAKFFVELGYDVAKNSFELLNSHTSNPEKSVELFNYLLAHGLDINAKEANETALYIEMRRCPVTKKRAKEIELLLKLGASVTEKNQQGISAIDIDPLIETRYANGLHIDYFLQLQIRKCQLSI